MRIIKISIISLAAIGLSACSAIGDKYGFLKDESQSYQKAPPVDRTVIIPQNLSSRNVQDYYEVPQASEEAIDVRPPITPPGSNLTQGKPQGGISQQDRIRNAESAKIQGHTSASANGPKPVGASYSQAWVKVGHILQAAKYKIVEKDNAVGTYYVIDTASTGGKVKKDMPIYQVHLKPSGTGTLVSVSPANPGLQGQLNRSLND